MWLKRQGKRELEPPSRVLSRRHTPICEPPRPIHANDHSEGIFLEKYAAEIVRRGVQEAGRTQFAGVQRVMSVCSGSSMDAVALKALEGAFSKESIDISFEIVANCECVKEKRAWIAGLHDILDPETPTPCNFEDLKHVSDDRMRRCGTHGGRACPLPENVDGILAGLSCKDLSRANTSKGKMVGSALWNAETSPGKSADCVHGFLNLVRILLPSWGIVENSDELAESDKQKPLLDELRCVLNEAGYDTRIFILDASDYGLPQRRKRMYLLMLRRPCPLCNILDYRAFFTKVQSQVDLFKVKTQSDLTQVLLDDSEDTIEKELQRRLDTRNVMTLTTKIMQLHRSVWGKLGLSFRPGAARVHAQDLNGRWWPTLCTRKQSCLEYHQHVRSKAMEAVKDKSSHQFLECAASFAVVDLAPSINMLTTGGLSAESTLISPTILPGAELYVSVGATDPLNLSKRRINRSITGFEALMLQGFPCRHEDFESFVASRSNHFLHDLAGNAFPSTTVMSIKAAMFGAMESARDHVEASGDDEVAEAIASLKRLRGEGPGFLGKLPGVGSSVLENDLPFVVPRRGPGPREE